MEAFVLTVMVTPHVTCAREDDYDDADLAETIRARFDESTGALHSGISRTLKSASVGEAKRAQYLLVGRPVSMQARCVAIHRQVPFNDQLIRREMDEEEQLRIDRLKLAPAPELYFGRGLGFVLSCPSLGFHRRRRNESKPIRVRNIKTAPPRVLQSKHGIGIRVTIFASSLMP